MLKGLITNIDDTYSHSKVVNLAVAIVASGAVIKMVLMHEITDTMFIGFLVYGLGAKVASKALDVLAIKYGKAGS